MYVQLACTVRSQSRAGGLMASKVGPLQEMQNGFMATRKALHDTHTTGSALHCKIIPCILWGAVLHTQALQDHTMHLMGGNVAHTSTARSHHASYGRQYCTHKHIPA